MSETPLNLLKEELENDNVINIVIYVFYIYFK